MIAVVGLSDREETTSNRVSKGDAGTGHRIIPVNCGQRAVRFLVRLFMPVLKISLSGGYCRGMYTAAVSFCRMWHLICSRMPRFSGLSWAWRVRRLSRQTANGTTLPWTAGIKREHTRLILGEYDGQVSYHSWKFRSASLVSLNADSLRPRNSPDIAGYGYTGHAQGKG